ncbi:MAG TPA: hypothetical protein VL403_04320 [Candidatus Kryptonia bacterium]|nr:hypothetical protein [Candidatus Kryptonia bacterium]
MAERSGDGKGRRVAGFFVFMLGAGLLLESSAVGSGMLTMLLGAAIFGRGVFVQPSRETSR